MTTTQHANRIAAQADNSQAVADAYRHLAHLIRTNPKFKVLIENEVHACLDHADEYDRDAEWLRSEGER